MIPREVLTEIAKRFHLGGKLHAVHNWKRGGTDVGFVRDRYNHMIEHALKFTEGGDEEDNQLDSIVAVLINAVFLVYWTVRHPDVIEKAFYADFRGEKL